MKFRNAFNTLAISAMMALAFSCNEGSTGTTEQEKDREQTKTSQESNAAYEGTELQQFAAEATSDGMMEVRMAQMAVENSENSDVQRLANTIRRDHERANDELKELSIFLGWNLPTDMMDKHRQKIKELRDTEDFDRKYLQMMVSNHQEAIRKFEEASERAGERAKANKTGNNEDDVESQDQKPNEGEVDEHTGSDGGNTQNQGAEIANAAEDRPNRYRKLQKWIDDTLPVLREHLERSQELQERIAGAEMAEVLGTKHSR